MARRPIDLEAVGRIRNGLPPYPNEFDFYERRRKAAEFRTARIPYEQIGLLLAADPKINSRGVAFNAGYGWRQYRKGDPPPSPAKLIAGVERDIDKAMTEARVRAMENSDRLLAEEIATIDAVTQAMWSEMAAGSHWHGFRILQGVELRAKLEGLLTAQGVNPALAAAAEAIEASSPKALEGPQPTWEVPGFTADVVAVLSQSGLITDDQADAALRAIGPANVPVDANVIDVDSDEPVEA